MVFSDKNLVILLIYSEWYWPGVINSNKSVSFLTLFIRVYETLSFLLLIIITVGNNNITCLFISIFDGNCSLRFC